MTTLEKLEDFLTFKKYLSDNNIFLFDSQYRIVHHRFNNLNKLIQINEQKGGNIKLKNFHQKYNLKHFINALLTKNINRINWIINNS